MSPKCHIRSHSSQGCLTNPLAALKNHTEMVMRSPGFCFRQEKNNPGGLWCSGKFYPSLPSRPLLATPQKSLNSAGDRDISKKKLLQNWASKHWASTKTLQLSLIACLALTTKHEGEANRIPLHNISLQPGLMSLCKSLLIVQGWG